MESSCAVRHLCEVGRSSKHLEWVQQLENPRPSGRGVCQYVLDPIELVGYQPGPPGTGTSYPEAWYKTVVLGKQLGTSVEDLKAVVSNLVSKGPIRKQLEALPSRADFETIKTMSSLGFPQIMVQSLRGPLVATNIVEL